MRQVNLFELCLVCVLGIILFVMAITLVNVQYRARTLFVEHERAVDVGRRLADDQADLLLKVRKAALPGSISEGAKGLGLEVARGENTVNLVVDEHHRVSFAPDAILTNKEEDERDPKAKGGRP